MKKYFLLLLITHAFVAIGQTENDIRNHYQEVNKQIAESIAHGFEGSLYNNHWETNKNSKSWPAVGMYHETTDFWYNDDPNHISTQERNPKTVLLKIAVARKSASLTTSEEYLYKDGKLVFYFSSEAEEGKDRETRLYFNAKGVFKSSVKADGKELTAKQLATGEYSDFKPNIANIQKYGKKYQDLFVKDMVE